ncbi:MAG TPA: helix-turn-helix domain-containing protein, partial [Solirubrobacterales bacterium]|nr:helix-turn-helix domain-containing protein [Solirubrobacterales bacterium]
MTKPRAISGFNPPRRLPRGRHALSPEQVLADQRQRLLEAVPSVVAERGYEAMTVADIVKKAAVSRNAFYRSFSDKQDCFASAHEACQEQLLAILTQACKGRQTFEQKVENALAAALDGLASHPDVAR